jgi:hypothetical protein
VAESTILGMPIQVNDDLKQPLGAVVVVKGLDEHGDVCHWICKTDDISKVEAVGMLTVASDEFRATLLDLPRCE